MKSVSCNRSSNLSSRACIGVISCGYHTGETRNQILSRVVFPLYSLGGILPQECFSGGPVKIYAQIYLQAPLLKLSRYLEEDADFYRPLVRVNGSGIFMEKLKKVLTDHMLHDSDIPDDMRHSKMVSLHICYFAGGIVNLYKQWFRGDLDCTLDDIAMEVSKLLHLKAQELFGT